MIELDFTSQERLRKAKRFGSYTQLRTFVSDIIQNKDVRFGFPSHRRLVNSDRIHSHVCTQLQGFLCRFTSLYVFVCSAMITLQSTALASCTGAISFVHPFTTILHPSPFHPTCSSLLPTSPSFPIEDQKPTSQQVYLNALQTYRRTR